MNLVRKTILFASLAASVGVVQQSGSAFGEEQKTPQPQQQEVTKTSPGDPLAKVNGTPITRGDVERAVKVMLAQNRATEPLPQDIMKQAEAAALEQLISAELLYQAGQKLELKDLDKQVEAKISQGKAKFPTPAEYEAALKSANLTEKDLTELTRKDLVIGNLVEKEIAGKVVIPDAEAKKFYEENIDKFRQSEAVRASHILCSIDQNATPEEKKKAKEKAEALRKRVLAGEDFAAIAKSDSTCPSSAQGGDLGFFGKGQMVPPFEQAAFALKPGEISEVVETQFGYHVIKLTEKKEASTVKFDEVKERIVDYLKGQKVQQGVNDRLAELRGKAKIEKTAN